MLTIFNGNADFVSLRSGLLSTIKRDSRILRDMTLLLEDTILKFSEDKSLLQFWAWSLTTEWGGVIRRSIRCPNLKI